MHGLEVVLVAVITDAPNIIPDDWEHGTLVELVLVAGIITAGLGLARRAWRAFDAVHTAAERLAAVPQTAADVERLEAVVAPLAEQLGRVETKVDGFGERLDAHLVAEEQEARATRERLAAGGERMAAIEAKLDVVLGPTLRHPSARPADLEVDPDALEPADDAGGLEVSGGSAG